MRIHKVQQVSTALLTCLVAPVLMGAVGTNTSFDHRLLAAHNRERDKVGTPALVWDANLAAGAKEWAQHLASSGQFAHSPDTKDAAPIGENIWGGTPGAFPPEAMIALWISEKKHFQSGVFPANSRTGDVHDVAHYTQLIWKSSGRVGCGLGKGLHEDVLVCRYSEAGNVMGESPL